MNDWKGLRYTCKNEVGASTVTEEIKEPIT
jgi:hypothetical protein